MVRIISDTQPYQGTHGSLSQELNLIKELMAHNGENYLRYSTLSRNSWLINGKNDLRYSTLSRNSWLIMVRIIIGAQPYQGTHGS
jgi:hypothetical protein